MYVCVCVCVQVGEERVGVWLSLCKDLSLVSSSVLLFWVERNLFHALKSKRACNIAQAVC